VTHWLSLPARPGLGRLRGLFVASCSFRMH
jgi:hypothetical protein